MAELIEVGAEAPAFSLPTADGETFSLEDARGTSRPLLIFYPKDFTPGCLLQLRAINKAIDDLRAADITPYGVNPGDAASHQRFESMLGLTYPLLVDGEREVAAAYGALKDNGKSIQRSVVLVGKDGKVAFAKRGAPSWELILEALKTVEDA